MDNIKKKFQIVVAKYNEDISWLLPYKDITIIYNKGANILLLNKFEIINLENFGRESHTYLYHIINNYDNLAEKTIFFQGKISDHKILDIEDYFGENEIIGKFDILKINKLKKKIDHYGKYEKDYKNGNMKICNLLPFDWITKNIGINLDNIDNSKVVWGANFTISRDIIRSKPKIFYENIFRYINYHVNPEEGHYLERCWYLIFKEPYFPKDKLGYLFVKDNFEKIKNILNQSDFKEIHLWVPIEANKEFGYENKINYTPNNNKYLIINPEIHNNEFYLNIKGNNNAYILIEFLNTETKYEIVLGGWNNARSIIRDYNKNTIINSYENSTLNKNEFVKFDFYFNDKIIIKSNNNIIFEMNNIYENLTIKNVKIKSYFNSEIYWDYDHGYDDNFKVHMCNNIYDDIELFYQNNYLNYYVEKINILTFI